MNISSSLNHIALHSTLQHAGPVQLEDAKENPERLSVPPVEEGKSAQRSGDKANTANKDAEDVKQQRAEKLQEQRDQLTITKLKARDREVRAHEAAHAAVGGQYAGAPTYTFQRGPNGVSYAVGGEVQISTSEVAGDPEATLQKALQVQRAALAPADPSAQDRSVAAQASQMAVEARIDIASLQQAEQADARVARSEATEADNDSDDAAGTTEAASESDEPTVNVPQLLANAGVVDNREPGQLLNQLA